jgi:hypothetical protein
MVGGGKLTIETGNKELDEHAARRLDLPPGPYVTLCVTDTGVGRQSGGQIKIDSEPEKGASVCIYLPRSRAEATAADLEVSPSEAKNHLTLSFKRARIQS